MSVQQVNIDINGVSLSSLKLTTLLIDPVILANKLQAFVHAGSRRFKVDKSELRVYKPNDKTVQNISNINELLEQGTPFFDALFFMAIDPLERPPSAQRPLNTAIQANTVAQISDALFYQYFFILTRGSASEDTSTALGTAVPNFLRTVMALDQAPVVYARRLASFNINKVDPSWARHIQIGPIGAEATNRFGLGVAGYRLLAPFKLAAPMAGISPNLMASYEVARSMATSPASWDIHPATRDPNILQRYGPLNKNLEGLMVEVFPPEQIADWVANKVLFKAPTIDPKFVQYRTWVDTFASVAARQIF